MMYIRRSRERGYVDHGWLKSYHRFSFASYHDREQMGFRALRVINDDIVMEGQGFGTHPHKDMEILTYVLSGALEHKDSMGNGRIIRPGEVQGMSAGTGVTHSEFNPSGDEPVHLLQMWILPHTKNVTPRYAEWKPDGSETKEWALTASENGERGSVPIHQDAKLYVTKLAAGESRANPIEASRFGYLHVARGLVKLGDVSLSEGDGAAFDAASFKAVAATAPAELLLFDLA